MAKLVIRDIPVYYTRTCETACPKATLVFLHGWQGSSESWEPNTAWLSKYFDCIALDFPGFGISSPPASVWGVSEYAAFVKNFIEKLNLSNVVLVGKSFGGRIAIFYASKWPQTLSHLILVAAAGVEKRGLITLALITVAKLGKWLLALVGFKNLDKIRGSFYGVVGVRPDKSSYKWELKKKVTTTDLAKQAADITVPTLIVWGNQDKILPLRWGKKLNRLISTSVLRQLSGGHSAHFKGAERFNQLIMDYLLRS